MRLPFLACVLALCTVASAQDTLSANDFYALNYKLSPSLQPTDSAAVDAQLRSLAPQLQADVQPYFRKPLKDSALLTDLFASAVLSGIYREQYAAVLQQVDAARHFLFRQHFGSPWGLVERAYASGKLAEAAGRSFESGLLASMEADLKLVDPAFVKDVASSLKGRFVPAVAEVYGANVRNYLQGAQQSGGSIEVYNLPLVMQQAVSRWIVRQHGPAVLALLQRYAPNEVLRQVVQVPMRDGIRLNGLLFRDSLAAGKVPVIIMQSPYPSGMEARQGNIYAINGYVFLYVDCRGRRASEGTFFPYENDARDYYDIIDWAVKQPWCNGIAASTGGSYLGFTQWQAIRREYRHPALKAINPMVAVGFGVDFPRNVGAFYPYILRWADYVYGKELNSARFDDNQFWRQKEWQAYKNRVPFARFDSVAGIRNPFFTRWLQHPDFDGYWRGILPKEADYKALDIPVLTTTGYYDDDQNGALYYYRNHLRLRPGARHYVLIGPFNHGGAQWMPGATQGGRIIDDEAQIPLYKYVIGWFDWALKGAALPAFFRDKTMYYEPASRSWKGAPSVDAVTTRKLRLFVAATAGKPGLQPAQGRDTVFAYTHDLWSVRDSVSFFNPRTDSAYDAFNPGLVFRSAPLDRDYVLTGVPSADLLLAVSSRDADLDAVWTLELPDGTTRVLGTDGMRLRYRRTVTAPVLMRPGVFEPVHFGTAYFNAERLPKGARLRFQVLLRNDGSTEKNWGYGGEVSSERASGPRPVDLKLRAAGSFITLPVQ